MSVFSILTKIVSRRHISAGFFPRENAIIFENDICLDVDWSQSPIDRLYFAFYREDL